LPFSPLIQNMPERTQTAREVASPEFRPDPAPVPPAFARHDTFHPRHGWLKKAYELAIEHPDLFSREDAAHLLGVGKNMVRAIRYWSYAFDLLEAGTDGNRRPVSRPTQLGRDLLDNAGGWDPYLEDAASLWLLHWRLVSRPGWATGWTFTFFRFGRSEFSVRDLARAFGDFVDKEYTGARYAPSSYEKDASCLLRMYTLPPGDRLGEESIQCPFAELGLLRPGAEPGTFAFSVGPKPSLPDEMIAAACAEFLLARASGARTIALHRLLHDLGSPGLAFRLSESALYGALESVADTDSDLAVVESAGVIQLAITGDPAVVAARLWAAHFARNGALAVAA
jgi:hypothetical protein